MKRNKILKAAAITLGVIAFLGAAGSFAFGGFIADKILHQNEGKDTHNNSIKQLEIWKYDTAGFEARYKGTEIKAEATDGNMVPGTLFDMGSDTCVILVHGAGGDRVCTYPLAEEYLKRGYDVIAIDQRGFRDLRKARRRSNGHICKRIFRQQQGYRSWPVNGCPDCSALCGRCYSRNKRRG